MRAIKNLEMHVTHACNLRCESCSHYSDQGHKGMLSLEEADEWMKLWNQRLSPARFSLLGGEPTIHPRLAEFVFLARRHWPSARRTLVTNGFFLHRHPDLPSVLKKTETILVISIHHDSPAYLEKVKPIFALLKSWRQDYGIPVVYRHSYQNWTRRYRGFGEMMQPFEGQRPRQSWKICPARYCRQLFEGRIWKCSPLAYLKLQNAKYKLSEKWAAYLAYQPLEPDCTDEELNAFFDRQDEVYCNMCPAIRHPFAKPLPLSG